METGLLNLNIKMDLNASFDSISKRGVNMSSFSFSSPDLRIFYGLHLLEWYCHFQRTSNLEDSSVACFGVSALAPLYYFPH